MRFSLQHVRDLQAIVWRWPHIDPVKEWADHADGSIVVETEYLDRLERLRARWGKPVVINSGYRSPAHNARVSDTGRDGAHTTGRAADVRVYGADALALIPLALELGFTGIGVQQKGPHAGRYLHLDDLEAPAFPRPMIWSY